MTGDLSTYGMPSSASKESVTDFSGLYVDAQADDMCTSHMNAHSVI